MSSNNAIVAALDALNAEEVEFILIGGAAVILHGAAYVTEDVDFCCRRDAINMDRLARALNALNPRFRVLGLPARMPTRLDSRALRAGSAFAFITDIGNLDVRFDVDGIGDFDAVLALAQTVAFGSRNIRMLSLLGLIQTKAFMKRPRDLQVLPELEMMLEAIDIAANKSPSE